MNSLGQLAGGDGFHTLVDNQAANVLRDFIAPIHMAVWTEASHQIANRILNRVSFRSIRRACFVQDGGLLVAVFFTEMQDARQTADVAHMELCAVVRTLAHNAIGSFDFSATPHRLSVTGTST